MHISVTLLSSYLYCKRKLFLERVLRVTEPPKEALVKGSIRHAVYDGMNKIDEDIVKSILLEDGFSEIYKHYLRNFSKLLRNTIEKNKYSLKEVKLPLIDAYKQIWPFFERDSMIRAERIFNFKEMHGLFGAELWEKLTPKIQSEIKITSDSLMLKGIIDQLEIYEAGYVPIELKTGKMPNEGMWPGHRIQLGAYALLLEEKFNTVVKEGFVHYLDKNERRYLGINPFLREEILALRDKVKQLLESKEIPELEKNENKCNACGLRKECRDEKFILNKLKQLNRKL